MSADGSRGLERALLWNFLVHGLAMLAMVALLLPALPGGSSSTDAQRIATIAEHPWLFRLGWFPWQLCALFDLVLAVAMLRTRWLSRAGCAFVVVTTALAVIPDQTAQCLWVTRGTALAATDPAAYLAFERATFPLTAGYGALLYTVAALGWTYCFARAGTWSRALTVLSVPLWATMLVASSAPLLSDDVRPSPAFVSAANAVGFVLLQLWLAAVTERVLRRRRPDERFGRAAVWRYPSAPSTLSSLFGRALDVVANSRFAEALLDPLPVPTMQSDITRVVYVSYLVPSAVASTMVPPGLELQRLGKDGAWALFTFLTYRHGHFGFALLGPLRKLLPSPIQTNWRVHVVDPRTGHRGITFVTNAITAVLPALAARLTSAGMPMHVLQDAVDERAADGSLHVMLDAGGGSAPDAVVDARPASTTPVLTREWAECFGDWRGFLAYCVPQDRAMSSQPLLGRVSRHEIALGIPLDACIPLDAVVTSKAAAAIAGDAQPLCFLVENVAFRFSVEAHDHAPDEAFAPTEAAFIGRNQ